MSASQLQPQQIELQEERLGSATSILQQQHLQQWMAVVAWLQNCWPSQATAYAVALEDPFMMQQVGAQWDVAYDSCIHMSSTCIISSVTPDASKKPAGVFPALMSNDQVLNAMLSGDRFSSRLPARCCYNGI